MNKLDKAELLCREIAADTAAQQLRQNAENLLTEIQMQRKS